MTNRYKPEVRKASIIAAALELAERGHYTQVQRKQVAQAVGVTPPAITYHYRTMGHLRRGIMRAAVDARNLVVIAQGLSARDPFAAMAPDELKQLAIASIPTQ